jgi:hypothetical protein
MPLIMPSRSSRSTARATERMASRIGRGTSSAMPQSSTTIAPVVDQEVSGCGSACRNPSIEHHAEVEPREALHDVLEAELPRGEAVVEAVHLRARMYSMTSTRRPETSSCTAGTRTPGVAPKCFRNRSMFRASERKSISSRTRTENSRTTLVIPCTWWFGKRTFSQKRMPEGEIQVQGHHLLDVGAEHLEYHVLPR